MTRSRSGRALVIGCPAWGYVGALTGAWCLICPSEAFTAATRSSRRLRDGGGASGRVQHPAAEQGEPGAAVHGALDRLQPADLALDGTRRPRRLERRPNGREVLPETLGEARERCPGRGREPPVQCSRPLLPDQGGEAAGETVDLPQ